MTGDDMDDPKYIEIISGFENLPVVPNYAHAVIEVRGDDIKSGIDEKILRIFEEYRQELNRECPWGDPHEHFIVHKPLPEGGCETTVECEKPHDELVMEYERKRMRTP
jgi:hypothetical protein